MSKEKLTVSELLKNIDIKDIPDIPATEIDDSSNYINLKDKTISKEIEKIRLEEKERRGL